MSDSGARRRGLFELPFTPPPQALPALTLPRSIPSNPPAHRSRTRDPRPPACPEETYSLGASSSIPSPSPGRQGALHPHSPSPSPSPHPQPRTRTKTKKVQGTELHPLSPLNASNPALMPLYNCLIFFFCCLPGPGGRGVEVGLCPRISTGERPRRRESDERRTRERVQSKEEEMERWRRELEVESSTTGITSSEGRGGSEGKEKGKKRVKGKGKEGGISISASTTGSTSGSSSQSPSWTSSVGSTQSSGSTGSSSSSGSSSSGSSSSSSGSASTAGSSKGDLILSVPGSPSSADGSGVALSLEEVLSAGRAARRKRQRGLKVTEEIPEEEGTT